MSRYRDPQLQVGENYSYVFDLRQNIWKSLCLNTHIVPNNFDLNLLMKCINKLSRCIKESLYIPENTIYFPTTKGFRRKICMKLVYQDMAIFFDFSPTSGHFRPLQVENCDSNSRLVVDEEDNGQLRVERVKTTIGVLTGLTITTLRYVCMTHGDQRVIFNLKSS